MALLCKAGSFAARTSTGTQTITGFGFSPRALLIWTAGGTTTGSFRASYCAAAGIATGPGEEFGVGFTSRDGITPSDANRTNNDEVLTLVGTSGGIVLKAELQSLDSDGLTLNYLTVDGTAYLLHYLALGGSDLTGAKAIQWTAPTSAGNQSVSGAGFQPDCVLHLFSSHSDAYETVSGSSRFCLGAMDSAGRQWASDHLSVDNRNPSDTQRSQATNRCIRATTLDLLTQFEAAFVSMDADGFTTNWATVTGGVGNKVWSLCLKGGRYHAGSFSAPTGSPPAATTVTAPGFAPCGYLLSSFCKDTTSGGTNNARQAVGASDGTSEECALWLDDNNASTSAADGLDKTDKVLALANNASPAVDAEADHSQMTSSGFELTWTTTSGTAFEVLYLAFGSDAGAPKIQPERLGLSPMTPLQGG